jgi:dihydrofolate synthase/folylpolyglutamate synthase
MFQRVGPSAYKANLDTTIRLADLLGNPEAEFPSVHIAGTNGKGSVAHMTASVLQEAGYKTGLYTSPHLKDFRERIRINGAMIPKSKVVGFVDKYSDLLEKIQPSFFEYTFGMAMLYFAQEKVDIAVVETGMGGRLDSTNIIHPVLTVITNIGMDHTQFLGNTLKEIAGEKAGIMKASIPMVIGETRVETEAVFRNVAKTTDNPLYFADQDIMIEDSDGEKDPAEILYKDINSGRPWFRDVSLPFYASYQQKNLRTALFAIERLQNSGWDIADKNVRTGIQNVVSNTGFSGRWQILKQSPLTICDTGHNPDGIKEVVSQIQKLTYHRVHFVLGVVEDKKLDDVLFQLPKDALYYFCKADIPRGLDAGVLRDTARQFRLEGEAYASVRGAYDAAKQKASEKDLIFIGGSTFVVAEIL